MPRRPVRVGLAGASRQRNGRSGLCNDNEPPLVPGDRLPQRSTKSGAPPPVTGPARAWSTNHSPGQVAGKDRCSRRARWARSGRPRAAAASHLPISDNTGVGPGMTSKFHVRKLLRYCRGETPTPCRKARCIAAIVPDPHPWATPFSGTPVSARIRQAASRRAARSSGAPPPAAGPSLARALRRGREAASRSPCNAILRQK